MVYMCHFFFVHAITDGRLGWFQVFAIVNSAMINICVHVCLYNRRIYIPLSIYPVMGLLGQMEFLFLGPWGIATLSSTMVELIYTPMNSVTVFISTNLPKSVVFCLFIKSHSHWCEMGISLWFLFEFPKCSVMLSFLSYYCWTYVRLLLRSVCSCPLPTF